MALTQKQLTFCKNIVAGMTGKEAYKSAYNTNASEQVLYNEASKLLLRDDIQAEIKTIMEPLEQVYRTEQVSARQKQIDFILSRIEICKAKEDENSIIRYTDMLNKIYGTYKETETETGENPVTTLPIETLYKLTGTDNR